MCHLSHGYTQTAVNKNTSEHAPPPSLAVLLKTASLAGMQELQAGLSRTKALQWERMWPSESL